MSSIASSSRDPQLCDQMKGSLIKKQVRTMSVMEMMDRIEGTDRDSVVSGGALCNADVPKQRCSNPAAQVDPKWHKHKYKRHIDPKWLLSSAQCVFM